ncbi:hypothetical protein [Faecalimicrobium sp. JNUCC 81]
MRNKQNKLFCTILLIVSILSNSISYSFANTLKDASKTIDSEIISTDVVNESNSEKNDTTDTVEEKNLDNKNKELEDIKDEKNDMDHSINISNNSDSTNKDKLLSVSKATLTTRFNMSEVVSKNKFIYELEYNIDSSNKPLKLKINIPFNLVNIISSSSNDDILDKEITDEGIVYTIKKGDNLSNKITLNLEFNDNTSDNTNLQLKSNIISESGSIITTNSSPSIKLIKPLKKFSITTNKSILKPNEEFEYRISYEMDNIGQQETSIKVTIPSELEVIEFKNKEANENIIDETYENGTIIYKLKTNSSRTIIKDNLKINVKFKNALPDTSTASVHASINYPSEYTISSIPVIFRNSKLSISASKLTVTENDNYSYSYNIQYKILGNATDSSSIHIEFNENIKFKENSIILGDEIESVNYLNNKLIIKLKHSVSDITGSIKIPVEFKEPSTNDIGKITAFVSLENSGVQSEQVESEETIAQVNTGIKLSKQKVGSSVIVKDNGIAEYDITISNDTRVNLNGFSIIDVLPNKNLEFIGYNVKSSGNENASIGTFNYNKQEKEIEFKINKNISDSRVTLTIKVKYLDLVDSEFILNTAKLYDKKSNLLTSVKCNNQVRDEAEGLFFGKRRASKPTVGYEGTSIWNIVMQNPTSRILDNLTVEDTFPHHMRLNKIELGKYKVQNNSDLSGINNMSMDVYISTKQNSNYIHYLNISGNEMIFGTNTIHNIEKQFTTDENYITKIKIVINNPVSELIYSKPIRFYTQIQPSYENGTTLQSGTILTNKADFTKTESGIKSKSVSKSDSVEYIRAYNANISKSIVGDMPKKIGDLLNYKIVLSSTVNENLPNPIIWDSLPHNIDVLEYDIEITDRKGTSILSKDEINNIMTFEKDKINNIIRWKFKYILPESSRIVINLKTKINSIEHEIKNNVGVSTIDIPFVQGVQSTDFPQNNRVEDGVDYDGNIQYGDLYVSSSASLNFVESMNATLSKYSKLENQNNFTKNELLAKDGDIVNYKLEVNNNSSNTLKLTDINDILPTKNDKNPILDYNKNSQFDVKLIENSILVKDSLGNVITNYDTFYSLGNNPIRLSSDGKTMIGKDIWDDKYHKDVKSIKVHFKDLELNAKDKITIEYSVKIPNKTRKNLKAINNFSAQFEENGKKLYPLLSNNVIVKTKNYIFVPPTEPDKPVVPPTEPDKPVVPPTEPDKPVVPPTEPDKPVVPPTEPDKPVVPPTEPDKPVVPPTEPDKPVVPPTEPDKPVVSPTELDKPFKITIDDITNEKLNPKTGDDSLLIYIGASAICLILFSIINRKKQIKDK